MILLWRIAAATALLRIPKITAETLLTASHTPSTAALRRLLWYVVFDFVVAVAIFHVHLVGPPENTGALTSMVLVIRIVHVTNSSTCCCAVAATSQPHIISACCSTSGNRRQPPGLSQSIAKILQHMKPRTAPMGALLRRLLRTPRPPVVARLPVLQALQTTAPRQDPPPTQAMVKQIQRATATAAGLRWELELEPASEA